MSQWRATALAAVAVLIFGTAGAAADAPSRVVSINLCTDQLAMMLAGEGQLLSVSRIAHDRNVSPMADEAGNYLKNYGQAEEVFMMQPDLVVAGVYTPRHTVKMLEDLGIPVVIFEITSSIAQVREQIARMGEVLHREDAAEALIADFDARLEKLQQSRKSQRSAMLYYANGFTSGEDTLANEILALAGFSNAAVDAGYNWGQKLPLEVVAMNDPDLIITNSPYPGGSRAEDVMFHPVLETLRGAQAATATTDSDWVCGTPFVLRAAEKLAAVRARMEAVTQ